MDWNGVTAGDRAKLSGGVLALMGKAAFDDDRFVAEVRRAVSGRAMAA
jgi:hypothetical protein